MNLNDTPGRIRWITFVVLIGLTLILLVADSTGGLEGLFSFLQDPLAAVIGWTTDRTGPLAAAIGGPDDLAEARQQISQLEARVQEQERVIEQLREVEGEYELLLNLFERARETPEYRRLTAKVIGYDTSPLFRSIIIDKGSDDGVFVGMPVESDRGLVGQVYRTTGRSAMVLLITDNISSVPGRLSDSRATGIVRGGGLSGVMTMDWIDLEAQLTPGEVVYSSGLAGKFPQDLIIGRVVDTQRRESDLFQQAVIQPAVDFSSLEMVFVITDFRAVDTTIFDTVPQDLPSGP
jgi:rod shape-determining protein MreC